MLGDTQWRWLEKELVITIIGSSVQVISNLSATTGPLLYMESWGPFPKERKRLFQLISDTKRNGVVFISGDVHFGEITRYDRFISCTYGQQNFGAISIDWNDNPAIRLEIKDVNGFTVLGTKVSLSELQARGLDSLKDPPRKGQSQRHYTLEVELPGTTRYRLAVLVYFTMAVLALVLVGLIIGAVLTITACVHKCKVD